MTVSPCTALCSAYARASPRHASTWSFRSATGAQRLSSVGTLVRVLEPLVKAGRQPGEDTQTSIRHAVEETPALSSLGNWGTFRTYAVWRVTTQGPVNRAVAAMTRSVIVSP